ncbi:MAG TPA: carotenoid oxygenase family protein [Burkholderiaceae bacterium]|nr:carotenoid oxygenase family protein [Burkholderiaceae bacterium]
MERRQFIESLACAAGIGAASALRPAWAQAAAPAPLNAIERFDAAVRQAPWLAALKGTAVDLDCESLAIEGRWPAELQGRFYRNGPALFERNGVRYQHWFDGDGMVQQFTFGARAGKPQVSHRGRFVRTVKFEREQAAGEFLTPTFCSPIKAKVAMRGPDDFNTANTNAIEHGGRVLAMWEGGSAFELDPATLATRGPVTWREGWAQVPFSAHPKLDPQGVLWNFGTFADRLLAYQIGADGKAINTQMTKRPLRVGMVHDFAITERYIVVPIPPITLDFGAVARGASPEEAFAWRSAEPLRIWVAEKDDISRNRLFELPNEMIFHVGNAHEQDGVIHLSYVGSSGNAFLAGDAVRIMRGDLRRAEHPADDRSQTVLAQLDLRSGQARRTALGDIAEFPRVNPQRIGTTARYLLNPTSWKNVPGRPRDWFHGLALRDLQTGKQDRYDYGEDVIAEEHLIIPRRGADTGRNERDAWVIGTSFDARRKQTAVSVFEAGNLAAGPVAVARLPYFIPLGFHGNFTAA